MGRNIIDYLIGNVGLFIVIVIFVSCTTTYPRVEPERADPRPTPTTGGSKMTDINRQELARRGATRLGPPILTALEAPETLVEPISTPFFSNDTIYRVSTRPPARPRQYMLGAWGKEEVIVLNNNPDGFFELAANSGLRISSGSDRVSYVTTFLESTRDYQGGVQILTKIEEAWWLPTPTPEEARQREELITKYAQVVQAPSISRESNDTVIVYLIRDRKLLRLHAKVEDSGRIEIVEDVLEPEVPTVMLR